MMFLRLSSWLPLLTIEMKRPLSTSTKVKVKTSLRSKSVGFNLEERPENPSTLLLQPSQIDKNVERLLQWFNGKKSVLCITGAGLSTDSGIPDYRGHDGSFRKGHKPMVHDEFMRSDAMRRRYWGRSMVGWHQFSKSNPNIGHLALTEMEQMNRIGVTYNCSKTEIENKISIITQNVDGLHKKSGSKHVIDLHGNMHRVLCMQCGSTQCRNQFHDVLNERNAAFTERVSSLHNDNSKGNLRADGDASIPDEYYRDLIVPSCSTCEVGFVKPDVVYFGDNVPSSRVEQCYDALHNCDGLLCIGTSLAVYSAFRFVQAAASPEKNIPIAILNIGPTRAEKKNFTVTKIESPIGITLAKLVEEFKLREDI